MKSSKSKLWHLIITKVAQKDRQPRRCSMASGGQEIQNKVYKQLVQVHACKLELQNVITEITRLGLELSTSEEPGPGP